MTATKMVNFIKHVIFSLGQGINVIKRESIKISIGNIRWNAVCGKVLKP